MALKRVRRLSSTKRPSSSPSPIPDPHTSTQRLHARDEEILWLRKQVEEFKALLLKNENRTVLLLEQLSL